MIDPHAANSVPNPAKQITRKIIMFPQISENTANNVYWLGWSLVLLSAMMGLAGTMLGFWGDKERERYSDLRLSDNEVETKRAVEGAAKANERAASLEKEAASARLEVEQIKEKQRPRNLSNDEEKRLISAMRSRAGESVNIDAMVGDSEAIEFATQIKDALEKAGIIVPRTTQRVCTVRGAAIMIKEQPESHSFAAQLQKALFDIGVEVKGIIDDKMQDNKADLIIGTKP